MNVHPLRLRLITSASFLLVAMGGYSIESATAAPLVLGPPVEHGTTPALNANVAIVTSASSPSVSGTSAALGDETFSHTNRTHEWTAVRTDASGVLNTAAAGTLQPFPSYLVGLEYVQIANENRAVTDYSLDLNFAAPVRAYLFLDNRLNGLATGNKSPNSTDPTLTGNLAWVVSDGWARVNTGFMPTVQADYLGIDEGATVAGGESLRTHHDPGSGNGLNNFFAIYTKDFPAGLNVGVTKAIGNNSPNMYGLAVARIPEPAAVALAAVSGLALAATRRRNQR